MSGDFIDSNPFVYLFDDVADWKRYRAREVVAAGRRTGAVVSYQVVQETLNVLLRKLRIGASAADARSLLQEVLMPFWRVQPTAELYRRALDIESRYRFSFYDSLIVAAALEAGCTRLLTEDLQHGQVIDGLRVENPFLSASA